MKTSIALFAAVGGTLITSLSIAQMGMGNGMGRGMGPGMMGNGPQGVSMVRHRYVRMNGLDPAYASARNPLAATAENLRAGKTLFENTCASCHGASGRGDGPAAKGLDPAPADLTVAVNTPIASDAFLDWTISEGGVPVGSVMPPFKTALSQDDIWKIVLYLRSL